MFEMQMQRVVAEPFDEIVFNELTAYDTLLIKTQNSTYSFIVTEPQLHQGILSGGSFGDRLVKAILIPSPAGAGQFVTNAHRLSIGTRLMFVVESRRGPIGGLTSAVTKILRLARTTNMHVAGVNSADATTIRSEGLNQKN